MACQNIKKLNGSALVFSLLILLVMTIIGIASMSGVLMQERMSGNVNLQSLAFEGASAGIGDALDYGMNELATTPCPNAAGNPWTGTFGPAQLLTMNDDAVHGVSVQYQLKTDCLLLPALVDLADGTTTSIPTFLTYVTSRGSVLTPGETTPLASREIEVRIDSFRRDGLSAMRIEGEPTITFEAGNSNAFTMHGRGGSAISTGTGANSAIVTEDIQDKDRMQNFVGGVGVSSYPLPFSDAAEMARFALRIKSYMLHKQATEGFLPSCGALPMRFVNGNLHVGSSSTLEGITYVTGNLTMGGNPSGSGLLIVEGTVGWRGTAEFQGMLISLGGGFELSGGGRGETEGMIYTANLNLNTLADPNSLPGGYGRFNDVNFGGPWFDQQPEIDPDTGAVLQPFVRGIASHLEIEPSMLLDPGYNGLAYHRLYSGCNHNNWPNSCNRGGPGNDGFLSSTIEFNGGGGHAISYNCGMTSGLRDALAQCPSPLDSSCTDPDNSACWPGCDPDDPDLRKNCPLSEPWPDPRCNIPGAGGKTEAIISWRENIGWRELL